MKKASLRKPAGKSAGTQKKEKAKSRDKAPKKVAKPKKPSVESDCWHCEKDLSGETRALFVEEELGRVFCSEDCITGYFAADVERLEKEYFSRLSPNDMPAEEKERHAHLRWLTLQEPDEVWRQKTLAGDFRYTLVSEFQPGSNRIWCVCICLFLRGEPSFLYLAFTTRNEAMVDYYRRGERVEWVGRSKSDEDEESTERPNDRHEHDGLADAWTDNDTFSANRERRADDIPAEDFAQYQNCVEETLENPDEVWTHGPGSVGEEGEEDPGADDQRMFHFMKHYPSPDGDIWFVIVAKSVDAEEQIEILDAFPTRDPGLVNRYRKGAQEFTAEKLQNVSRLVH